MRRIVIPVSPSSKTASASHYCVSVPLQRVSWLSIETQRWIRSKTPCRAIVKFSRLHNQLKEEYREDVKALVLKQMQEKAKYRHNAAMEQKAEEVRHMCTTAGRYEASLLVKAHTSFPSKLHSTIPSSLREGGSKRLTFVLSVVTVVLPFRAYRFIRCSSKVLAPYLAACVNVHLSVSCCSSERDPALEGVAEHAELKHYTTGKTSELHQAKVREIQEAAQDAALQDEALGLQEDHLARVIETLREFTGAKDSPANALLEQARQVRNLHYANLASGQYQGDAVLFVFTVFFVECMPTCHGAYLLCGK